MQSTNSKLDPLPWTFFFFAPTLSNTICQDSSALFFPRFRVSDLGFYKVGNCNFSAKFPFCAFLQSLTSFLPSLHSTNHPLSSFVHPLYTIICTFCTSQPLDQGPRIILPSTFTYIRTCISPHETFRITPYRLALPPVATAPPSSFRSSCFAGRRENVASTSTRKRSNPRRNRSTNANSKFGKHSLPENPCHHLWLVKKLRSSARL